MKDRNNAVIRVVSGPDADKVVGLSRSSYRVIGRGARQTETVVLDHRDSAFEFDLNEDDLQMLIERVDSLEEQAIGVHHSGEQSLSEFERYTREPDIALNDGAVSRVHAVLVFGDFGIGLVDMGSKNGTRVNGQALDFSPVGEKDLIQLGSTELRISF